MRNSIISRRNLLSLAIGGSLASCASFNRRSPFWGTIISGIDPDERTAVSRGYAERLPYASMRAWFDGAPKALVVLAEFAADGALIWQSAERQTLTTKGPFVVGALGTELELRGASLSPEVSDLRRAVGRDFVRTFDVFTESKRVRFAVRSRFRSKDIETVDVFERKKQLRRIVESATSEGKPRYRNDYWVDEADGFCWKSRQVVVPTLPHLNLEIVKRPMR